MENGDLHTSIPTVRGQGGRVESDGWQVPPTEIGDGTAGSQQGIEKPEEIAPFDVQCQEKGGGGVNRMSCMGIVVAVAEATATVSQDYF